MGIKLAMVVRQVTGLSIPVLQGPLIIMMRNICWNLISVMTILLILRKETVRESSLLSLQDGVFRKKNSGLY